MLGIDKKLGRMLIISVLLGRVKYYRVPQLTGASYVCDHMKREGNVARTSG
jgi:hypothetical protein